MHSSHTINATAGALAGPAPQKVNAFHQTAEAMSNARSLAERIGTLALRLLGDATQTANCADKAPSPCAVIVVLNEDAARTRRAIADAHAALDRIESELP